MNSNLTLRTFLASWTVLAVTSANYGGYYRCPVIVLDYSIHFSEGMDKSPHNIMCVCVCVCMRAGGVYLWKKILLNKIKQLKEKNLIESFFF